MQNYGSEGLRFESPRARFIGKNDINNLAFCRSF
jgi:hypothetical protein